jgi:anti-sigma factor (TIGR02949 family)
MIACKEAVERLWGYLDRNLDRRQDEELEQHLGLCRHCCGELEFAKQVRSKLASGEVEPLPVDARKRLENLLGELR